MSMEMVNSKRLEKMDDEIDSLRTQLSAKEKELAEAKTAVPLLAVEQERNRVLRQQYADAVGRESALHSKLEAAESRSHQLEQALRTALEHLAELADVLKKWHPQMREEEPCVIQVAWVEATEFLEEARSLLSPVEPLPLERKLSDAVSEKGGAR